MNHEANEKQRKKKTGTSKKNRTLIIIAAALLVVLILLVLLAVWILPANAPKPTEPTEPSTVPTTAPPTTVPTEAPTTEATEPPTTGPTEPEIPEELKVLREKNEDAVAWIEIPGTEIDYPVFYAPEEQWKYLYADENLEHAREGSLYIDERSTLEPRSDILLIQGHNMANGSMFGTLPYYRRESYWKEHKTITFSTITDGIREYEILAACYERVYPKEYTGFKYYQFHDAENEEEFYDAIDYFKKKSLYETGITAEYGDDLIILTTCSYHTNSGRFIVVARAKNNIETSQVTE